MKLYVWNSADNATPSYHSSGGIVVIATDIVRAREMIALATHDQEEKCSALVADPDINRECDGDEYIAIHPDAGCC